MLVSKLIYVHLDVSVICETLINFPVSCDMTSAVESGVKSKRKETALTKRD